MSEDEKKNKSTEVNEMVNASAPDYLVRQIKTSGIDSKYAEDDLRMPTSPLTREEFDEGKRLVDKCYQEKLQAAASGKKVPRLARREGNPFHEIYVYFQGLYEKKVQEKSMDSNTCVICGEALTDEKNKHTQYPYCLDCGRLMTCYGKLRGRDNASGYKHWNRVCVVCHLRPAHKNMRGMCRICYRLGERHNTHDPKDVIEIRRNRIKKSISTGTQISGQRGKNTMMKWVAKDWD